MKNIPEPPNELVELMTEPFDGQRAFTYNRERWLERLADIPGALTTIEELPDEVDRQAIHETFTSNYPHNIEGAFTAVMIWGYGKSGYGPWRTARCLTNDFASDNNLSPEVVDKLRKSVTITRENGAIAGYYYLNNDGKIYGLASSFFTKWLYYASVTGPDGVKGAAPILDDLMIDWFAEKNIPLRRDRTPDYKCYFNILTAWGRNYGLAPVEVEERIFRLIRRRSGDE